jgi:hypothetical protein
MKFGIPLGLSLTDSLTSAFLYFEVAMLLRKEKLISIPKTSLATLRVAVVSILTNLWRT